MTANLKVDARRPIAVLRNGIELVTPVFGAGLDLHIARSADIVLSGGTTISSATVTGNVNAGFDISFSGGAAMNVSLGVSGIGASVQAYSGNASLSVPLN